MNITIFLISILIFVLIIFCFMIYPIVQPKIDKFLGTDFPVDAVITFRGEKFNLNHNREGYNYEIKYCLRSISKNMPWIRRIYVLQGADSKVPSFFSENYEKNNVFLYNDDEIIPKQYLPTNNSDSIETFLTYLPGLSEQFIYFCDDIFVRKEVPIEYFFTSSGVPKRCKFPVIYHEAIKDYEFKTPPSPGLWYPHVPIAYTKTEINKYLNKYSEFIEYIRNIHSRKNNSFTSCHNIGLLYPCLQLHSNINFMSKGINNGEYEIEASDYYAFPRDMMIIEFGSKKFFCVNDESTGSLQDRVINRNKLRKIMEKIFPEKSRAEIDQYEYFGAGIKTDRKVREKTFKRIINIFNDNNIEYFVNYGALLGIIREGRLLEFDDDIDILVHEKNYDKAYDLVRKEYTLMRTDPDFCQGYVHEGQIELYKYTVNDKEVIDKWTLKHNDITGIQHIYDIYPLKVMYVPLLNLNVNIPNKPEKILENVYENWKVPTIDKGLKK
jgi:hypothetical protein